MIAETDVLGRTTRYEYYADGKRKKMTDPRGNVFEFEYDAGGHQTAMRFPDGSRVTYAYNEQGKKVAETDQLGHTKRFAWNDLGLLQQITDPLGHSTSYVYNEIGNLVSQTDANHHTTMFAYNKLGRRIGKTYPLGMSQSISYDVANRTTSVTDFNGETITSHYDQQGRLTQTDLPDGSAITYTYTGSDEIASVTNANGTTSYTYEDGRLKSVTDANGQTISYTYDALGRKQSVTVPSGTTTYGYDQYGRLDTVTSPDGTTTYTYDAHGNTASVIYPNGITTTYGYDNLNRLTSVETRTITNDLLASYAYTLNSKGQRTRIVEGAGGPATRTIDYAYDAADRLVEERITDPVLGNRIISYTYDPVGNRLTKTDNGVTITYTYDDNDRLLTEGGYAYTYDNNGNMLTKSGNGESWQLTYNALNQVTGADITTPSGATSVAYAYDHDGIRIGTTVNGTDVTRYLVDKNLPYAQVLEEQRSTGGVTTTTSYVYGDTLLSQSTAGIPQYYLYDGLGSVRGLTDSAGTLIDAYTYDAYGNWLDTSGRTINAYGYRGEQYDDALGAYYLRARYYQPGTGRFLTTDPMEGFPTTPISLHRYVYGNANPVNMFDPSGKMSLNEAMITTAIIGNLSAIAVGTCSEAGQQAYADFGEYIFPDAFVLGVNGYMSIPLTYMLQSALGFPHTPTQANYIRAYGREILFSVTSGQIGYFKTKTHGTEIGANLPIGEIGVEVYRGMVWNLWNADNYEGPYKYFCQFSVVRNASQYVGVSLTYNSLGANGNGKIFLEQ